MKKGIFIFVLFLANYFPLNAQDTFSILGCDSITREVGAAGASCVDLFSFPGYSNDFICELFPDTGAIASQASYIPANQANARQRMRAGDTPQQIINWLNTNDAGSNSSIRQYGTLRLNGKSVLTAGFTGTNCTNYKNHITGPNYTIHGNILLGKQVLDSMEARFLRTKGELACKLMAALQGAKMVGADTRCAPNNSSSLFAFIKVSKPNENFGSPAFLLSLKTHSGANIEPIDSLQKLFDMAKSCKVNTVNTTGISVFPNPAKNIISINEMEFVSGGMLTVYNILGAPVLIQEMEKGKKISIEHLQSGIYFLELICEEKIFHGKMVKE